MIFMFYTALIVAAGSGSRMGLGYNKLLYPLSDSQTVIEKTTALFQKDKRCRQIVIVINESDKEQMKALFSDDITFVIGGATRQESVYNGLKVVNEEIVLIHDGARPWLSKQSLDELLEGMQSYDACLLCVPVKDTIKRVRNGKVAETYPREELMQAQTPQAFTLSLIKSAYEAARSSNVSATDDAQIAEMFANCDVHVIIGSYENAKLTTKEDLYRK